jgi:hypothetical protein
MQIGERVRFHFEASDWAWLERFGIMHCSPSFGDSPDAAAIQALDNKLATIVSIPPAREYAYPQVDFEAVVVEFDHWWGDTYLWSDEDSEGTLCLVPTRSLEALAADTPLEDGPGPYTLVKATEDAEVARSGAGCAETHLQRLRHELALT